MIDRGYRSTDIILSTTRIWSWCNILAWPDKMTEWLNVLAVACGLLIIHTHTHSLSHTHIHIHTPHTFQRYLVVEDVDNDTITQNLPHIYPFCLLLLPFSILQCYQATALLHYTSSIWGRPQMIPSLFETCHPQVDVWEWKIECTKLIVWKDFHHISYIEPNFLFECTFTLCSCIVA